MKKIHLICTLGIAIFLFSCGARQEKVSENNDITKDTTAFPKYEEYNQEVPITDSTSKVITSSLKESADVLSKNESKNEPDTEKVMMETNDGKLKKTTVNPDKTEKIEKNTTNHSKKYYIIGGSYKKVDNANKMNAFFKAHGYKPSVLPKVANLYRVAVYSGASKKDVKVELNKLRKKFKDIKFWILWK
jgi:cell division septation protein DedD